jgi:hypothetical protein
VEGRLLEGVRMGSKARLLVAVVACMCGVGPAPVAAATKASTRVVIVEDRGVAAPGQIAGFSERCPASAPHAVSGTFGPTAGTPLAGQFLLTRSVPLHRTGWRVDVQNLSVVPQAFFAGAVCVGAPVRFAYPEATGVAPPGMDDGFNMPCPRRAPLAIGGFAGPQAPAGLGQIANDSAFPTRAGWDIGVRNLGGMPQPYYAGAVCVGRAMTIALVRRVRTVPPGRRAETQLRCPRRAPQPVSSAFAAGNVAARGQIVATDAFRSGAHAWYTGVRNLSNRPQSAVVGVVCVR